MYDRLSIRLLGVGRAIRRKRSCENHTQWGLISARFNLINMFSWRAVRVLLPDSGHMVSNQLFHGNFFAAEITAIAPRRRRHPCLTDAIKHSVSAFSAQ